jgi:hypothetical protein
MNYKINFFVLHHLDEKYASRKVKLLESFEKYKIPFIPIWVEEFKLEEITKEPFPSYTTNIQNFSLSLKHQYVLKNIASNDIDYGIVIEDDIDIGGVNDFSDFLNKCLIEFIQTEGDFCFFGGTDRYQVNNPIPNQYLYYGNITRCTHGYIISKKCAKIIQDQFHFNKNIDHLYNELIVSNNLKSAWTVPYLKQ